MLDVANDIKNALDMDDLETATGLAHTIKGLAGNIGAKELHLVAVDLETALRQESDRKHSGTIGFFFQSSGPGSGFYWCFGTSRTGYCRDIGRLQHRLQNQWTVIKFFPFKRTQAIAGRGRHSSGQDLRDPQRKLSRLEWPGMNWPIWKSTSKDMHLKRLWKP